MKIKDREEFEDAQSMARIAVERTNNSIRTYRQSGYRGIHHYRSCSF